MIIGLYPGNFDPITNGHLDIITRSTKIVDKLFVAIINDNRKNYLFDLDTRIKMVQGTTKDIKNIQVITFEGLLANCAKENKANVIIRGLRTIDEFEYEMKINLINTKLNPSIEIIYLMASEENSYLSSNIIREIILHGGEISKFVPNNILDNVNSLVL